MSRPDQPLRTVSRNGHRRAPGRTPRPRLRPGAALLGLLLAAGLVRGWRLAWQPLWWDEGYSVYFATEPLARMLRLTAQDIHPPLYYALLRGWLLLWGNAGPLALRSLSLLIGLLAVAAIWWLARRLFPARPRLHLLAGLLLAISPLHLFYSQEVRMYGLELLLGILSTGFAWQLTRGPASPRRAGLGYVLASAGLLYTEYFGALLLLAHLLWGAWTFRRTLARLRPLLLAGLIAGLAYLPWLLFAVPALVPYVQQKVVEDADRPLGLPVYLWRHLLAFSAGHIPAPQPLLRGGQILGGLLAVAAGAAGLFLIPKPKAHPKPRPAAAGLLAACLLLPVAVGFAVNLRMPFFPEGGERVLLFVLPYFLLLLALALDRLSRRASGLAKAAAGAGLAGLLLAGASGVWAFYTVPRYSAEDYRPLIRQTVQQGRDADTVFAVFPWQVGYWRAYAPVWGRGETYGPWPRLTPSPGWSVDVAAALDAALAQGKLWFPAHLALGGILEGQIEAYLQGQAVAVNFEQRWYSPSTRLSGWASAPGLAVSPAAPGTGEALADFGPAQLLLASRLGVGQRNAANEVLPVALVWRLPQPDALPLRVSLRLLDESGRLWSIRDFEWTDAWGQPDDSGLIRRGVAGLLIPAGVPPGRYAVAVGLGPVAQDTLFPAAVPGGHRATAVVGNLDVAQPPQALSPIRLPIRFPLQPPVSREGVRFLGASGYDPIRPTLAGTELELNLFVQAESSTLAESELYVSLLDGDGAGVAGWEGWPLPEYPTASWPRGALVRLPVRFFLPADLPQGRYQPVAGLREPETGRKSPPVALAELAVAQRPHNFAPPQPAQRLDPPSQFGVHALLLGYDLRRTDRPGGGGQLEVVLYWEALQPLLPPHQVFVHLVDGEGALLAQDDGLPGGRGAPAPSGTWLPGEFLTDRHLLDIPADASGPFALRVGLYDSASGQRLPVDGGGPLPDALEIPLALE